MIRCIFRVTLLVAAIFRDDVFAIDIIRSKTPAMIGEFTGYVAMMQLDKGVVAEWIPLELRNLVSLAAADNSTNKSLHPVVLMMGEQQNVGVQLVKVMRFPEILKSYQEAVVMIPNLVLRSNQRNGEMYFVFARVYVDDERIAVLGAKLNKSPKKFADFQFGAMQGDIFDENDSVISWSSSESFEQHTLQQPVDKAQVTELQKIFSQKKIESLGKDGYAIYDFNLMANARDLRGLKDGALNLRINLNGKLSWQSAPLTAKKIFTSQPNEYHFRSIWHKNVTFVHESR